MLAGELSRQGHTIATGGAKGVDHAAMHTTEPGRLEVYLPWENFNHEIIPKHARRIVYNVFEHPLWAESVAKYHPTPGNLSSVIQKLHARNYGVVEGCALVIALPTAENSGGTGQGIRIARELKIPLIQMSAKVAALNEPAALLRLAEETLGACALHG